MNYREAKAVLEGRAGCNYAAKLKNPSSRDRVKIANNTYLERRGPQLLAVRFHATDVLTFTPHYVELNSGGWFTMSTRDRLEYGPCRIHADRLGWQVVPKGNAWGDGHPYYDGIRVKNDGSGILKTQPKNPANFTPARTVSGWSGRPNSARRGHEPFWAGPDMSEQLRTAPVVMLRPSDIMACPYFILEPSHYRPDGSCRCDDPAHTEMSAWGYTWNGSEWKGETDDE